MQVFLILGHSTAEPEQASGVCGQGATQREAAEDYYLKYCASLEVDPDSMPQNAHHEGLIDCKVWLETSELGLPITFEQDDFVLCAVAVDAAPVPQSQDIPEPAPTRMRVTIVGWEHLQDQELAWYLVGAITPEAQQRALRVTEEALEADEQDESVCHRSFSQRQAAYEEALKANEAGNAHAVRAHLATFWSL